MALHCNVESRLLPSKSPRARGLLAEGFDSLCEL